MADEEMNNEQKLAQAAMTDPSIPRIYSNGFVTGLSHSDVFVLLQTGAIPSAVLHLSYNTAKTLAASLNEVVGKFESATGQTVLTIQESRDKLDQAEKKKK